MGVHVTTLAQHDKCVESTKNAKGIAVHVPQTNVRCPIRLASTVRFGIRDFFVELPQRPPNLPAGPLGSHTA